MTDIANTVDLRSFTIAVLAVGIAAYLYAVRRIAEPGPFVKGQARWRYRSRALRERVARARAGLPRSDRTPGWWLTRLEFIVAVGLVTLIAIAVFNAPSDVISESRHPLRLRLLTYGAVALAFFGLAWMIRIYRAPLRHDSAAYWRYHDGP